MHRFLSEPGIAQYARAFGSTAVKAAVDDVLREARAAAGRGAGPLLFADLVARVGGRLALLADDGLVPVLNATGVLLHTNLGRAPLAAEALTAVAAIASG
jgi:L-seryl-tRNA(Ser) seleniumtransferase